MYFSRSPHEFFYIVFIQSSKGAELSHRQRSCQFWKIFSGFQVLFIEVSKSILPPFVFHMSLICQLFTPFNTFKYLKVQSLIYKNCPWYQSVVQKNSSKINIDIKLVALTKPENRNSSQTTKIKLEDKKTISPKPILLLEFGC